MWFIKQSGWNAWHSYQTMQGHPVLGLCWLKLSNTFLLPNMIQGCFWSFFFFFFIIQIDSPLMSFQGVEMIYWFLKIMGKINFCHQRNYKMYTCTSGVLSAMFFFPLKSLFILQNPSLSVPLSLTVPLTHPQAEMLSHLSLLCTQALVHFHLFQLLPVEQHG